MCGESGGIKGKKKKKKSAAMLNERTEEVEAVRKKGGGEADCGWSDSENARLCPPSILPLLLRLEIHPSGSAADICVEDLGRTGSVLSWRSDCNPHLRGRVKERTDFLFFLLFLESPKTFSSKQIGCFPRSAVGLFLFFYVYFTANIYVCAEKSSPREIT